MFTTCLTDKTAEYEALRVRMASLIPRNSNSVTSKLLGWILVEFLQQILHQLSLEASKTPLAALSAPQLSLLIMVQLHSRCFGQQA